MTAVDEVLPPPSLPSITQAPIPVELLEIISSYCDKGSLLSLQQVNRRLRAIAGKTLWHSVRIDGARGFVSFGPMSNPIGKSLARFHDAVSGGMLSEASSWVRRVMITTPDSSLEAASSETSGIFAEHAKMTQELMIDVIPQYFTMLERMEVRSVSSSAEGTDWPMVISEMFDQSPDVNKYLRLDCLSTKPKPLTLKNVQVLTLRVARAEHLSKLIGTGFPSSLTKLELHADGELDAKFFKYATTNCRHLQTLHMHCTISNEDGIDWIPASVTELTQPRETPILEIPLQNNRILTLRAQDLDNNNRIIFNTIYPSMTRLHLRVSQQQLQQNHLQVDPRLFECTQKITTLHVNGASLKFLSANLHGFPNIEILIVESVILYMYSDARGVPNTYNASDIKEEMTKFAQALGNCKSLRSFYLKRPELGDYDDIMRGIDSISERCPHLHEIYLGSARPHECKPQDGWLPIEDKMFATVCQGVNPDTTFQTYRFVKTAS